VARACARGGALHVPRRLSRVARTRAGHARVCVVALPARVIEFRPFAESDLPLLRTWLEREHVRLWWREPIERELAEDMSGRRVILVDGQPAGMIQSYETEVD